MAALRSLARPALVLQSAGAKPASLVCVGSRDKEYMCRQTVEVCVLQAALPFFSLSVSLFGGKLSSI